MTIYPKRSRAISKIERKAGERLIPLSSLNPTEKRKLWTALQEYDPAKAALMQSMKTDPFILALQSRFGAELVMDETLINEYLESEEGQPKWNRVMK